MFLFLCFICGLIFCEELRLIETNPGHRRYVTEEEKRNLRLKGEQFFDLTNFPHLSYDPKNEMSDQEYPSAPQHRETVLKMQEMVSSQTLESFLHEFVDYPTRYYTSKYGTEAVRGLHKTYSDIISTLSTERQEQMTVDYFEHDDFPQPSLIVTFAPSVASDISDEIIIFGAHEDSISSDPMDAPGADDDGSGIVAALDVFRILATSEEFQPKRTLQFHGYAAEEAGLLGSVEIAEKYKSQNEKIYAMINFDMCGYHTNNTKWVRLIEDYTNSKLNQFVELMINEYTEMQATHGLCDYACSDHSSWNLMGYPSSFPFETELTPYYHTSGDTQRNVCMDMVEEFVKLGIASAVELSLYESQ